MSLRDARMKHYGTKRSRDGKRRWGLSAFDAGYYARYMGIPQTKNPFSGRKGVIWETGWTLGHEAPVIDPVREFLGILNKQQPQVTQEDWDRLSQRQSRLEFQRASQRGEGITLERGYRVTSQ